MAAIVVGYIPKAEGRAALRRAADEAKLRGLRLVIVNSTRSDSGAAAGVHAAVSEADAELVEIERHLSSAGIGAEVRHLPRGVEVAEGLIAVAEETNADFIVIGLRRRSAVGKLILGSNAQRVLLDAPCPVLAVKAESSE